MQLRMDRNLRAQVFETYNRFLNAFNEADMETINDCISYPLAYIGVDSVKMLDKFPIDPRELKERIGWATSNAFEIDVVAVSDKKAHVVIRNVRRLRSDGSLIEEATGFYAFKNTHYVAAVIQHSLNDIKVGYQNIHLIRR